MTDKARANLLKNGLALIDSLYIALDKAGGSGIPIKELQSMSFIEFASHICTNDIRFIFVDPAKEES